VASAYGWVTIAILSMVKRAHPLYSNRNNKEIIQDVKTQLSSKFEMKDLGATNFILSMEIKRDQENKKPWLNQRKCVETMLQRFKM
jgi:uncharacterized protein (DUF2249 family)